jgi:ribosomal protein L34E
MWGEQFAIRYDKRKARIDETQRQRGTAYCAACEQLLDGVARLEAR